MSEAPNADQAPVQSRLHRTLLKTQSDARLVELARAGHEPAFEEVVARYAKPLQRYCRRLLSDAAAEDAVQQTLLSAWSALVGGTDVRDLRPWLYRIAHNAMLRIVAKNGDAGVELPESLAGTDTPALAHERSAQLRATLKAVAGLPERQREALVATAVHGRSREEMAGVLGMTESAVRQLVHRARVSVRAAATAVVPMPVLTRLLAVRGGPEIATGTGAVGATAAVKWAAVIGVTGALIAGPAVTHGRATRETAEPAASAPLGVTLARAVSTVPRFGPADFGRPPAPSPLFRHARASAPAALSSVVASADPSASASQASDSSAAGGSDPATDPTATDPTATDPTATDPTPTDSTPADPTPTDPTPADPTPTDPVSSDPSSSDQPPTDGQSAPSDPSAATP